jgi:sugar-phosphatase
MIKLAMTDGQRRHSITCEAILFDMDGTLVDSTICVESTWRAWAMRHELDNELDRDLVICPPSGKKTRM